MANAFSLLTLGAKFDRRAYEKDMNIFKPQHVNVQPTSDAAADGSSARPKKKRKMAAGGDDEGPEPAASISFFGGGKASGQAAAPNGTAVPTVATRDPLEHANATRKAFRIKVAGSHVPPPLTSFEGLAAAAGAGGAGPARKLAAAIAAAGWAQPTPVQRQAIPVLLAQRELLAIAPTGSGKTAAFLVPLVISLMRMRRAAGAGAGADDGPDVEGGDEGEGEGGSAAWPSGVKALVLSPTHELAAQQARVLAKLLPGSGLRACLLTKATAAGAGDFGAVDVLVGNPLRCLALVREGRLHLSQVRMLIMDEADKLFDMGFMEQLDGLLAAATHPRITRALFSATLPERVEALARSVLRDPVRVTVGDRGAAAASVAQRLLFCGREAGKLMALRRLLAEGARPPVLVFVSSKERVRQLHRELLYDGQSVDSISAEQSKAARAAAVANFRSGATWVLICTDLIGRGMDFVGVSTVVNYDFPTTTADYVHRIGRTGRAGHTGEAVTFFTEEDTPRLRAVANLIRSAGGEVPEWVLTLKKGQRAPSSAASAAGRKTKKQQLQQCPSTHVVLRGLSRGDAAPQAAGAKRGRDEAAGGPPPKPAGRKVGGGAGGSDGKAANARAGKRSTPALGPTSAAKRHKAGPQQPRN